MNILVAGEKGAVLALEELLPPMAVPIVPTQTLHVTGAELAELTGEDAVWARVCHHPRGCRGAARGLVA